MEGAFVEPKELAAKRHKKDCSLALLCGCPQPPHHGIFPFSLKCELGNRTEDPKLSKLKKELLANTRKEAGGRISDVSGKKLDFNKGKTLSANRGIVGTSGAIHDAVIQAVMASVV